MPYNDFTYFKIDNVHCLILDNDRLYSEDVEDLFKFIKKKNNNLLSLLKKMINV